MSSVALEAVALSRTGDSAGAIALLRGARDTGPLAVACCCCSGPMVRR